MRPKHSEQWVGFDQEGLHLDESSERWRQKIKIPLVIPRKNGPKPHWLRGERAGQEIQRTHSHRRNPPSKCRFVNGDATLALTYGGQFVRGI